MTKAFPLRGDREHGLRSGGAIAAGGQIHSTSSVHAIVRRLTASVDDILGDPGSRLYHYTSREGAFEHILQTQTLRIAPFIHMNDPREAMDWKITMARFSGYPQSQVDADGAEFNAALKRRSKVVCFSEDDLAAAAPPDLARGWAHPRMWAQYAGNHTGACLIFDKEALAAGMSVALRPAACSSPLLRRLPRNRHGQCLQLELARTSLTTPIGCFSRSCATGLTSARLGVPALKADWENGLPSLGLV
jgi:hypothetical protein